MYAYMHIIYVRNLATCRYIVYPNGVHYMVTFHDPVYQGCWNWGHSPLKRYQTQNKQQHNISQLNTTKKHVQVHH